MHFNQHRHRYLYSLPYENEFFSLCLLLWTGGKLRICVNMKQGIAEK